MRVENPIKAIWHRDLVFLLEHKAGSVLIGTLDAKTFWVPLNEVSVIQAEDRECN